MSNLIREALEAALSELAECSKAVQVQERVREALAALSALPVRADYPRFNDDPWPLDSVLQSLGDFVEWSLGQGYDGDGHENLREAVRRAKEIREALAASVQADRAGMEGWRPMETAPRDGTAVLLFSASWYQGKGGLTVGLGSDEGWRDVGGGFDLEPSAWMPLPAAPAPEQGKEGGT